MQHAERKSAASAEWANGVFMQLMSTPQASPAPLRQDDAGGDEGAHHGDAENEKTSRGEANPKGRRPRRGHGGGIFHAYNLAQRLANRIHGKKLRLKNGNVVWDRYIHSVKKKAKQRKYRTRQRETAIRGKVGLPLESDAGENRTAAKTPNSERPHLQRLHALLLLHVQERLKQSAKEWAWGSSEELELAINALLDEKARKEAEMRERVSPDEQALYEKELRHRKFAYYGCRGWSIFSRNHMAEAAAHVRDVSHVAVEEVDERDRRRQDETAVADADIDQLMNTMLEEYATWLGKNPGTATHPAALMTDEEMEAFRCRIELELEPDYEVLPDMIVEPDYEVLPDVIVSSSSDESDNGGEDLPDMIDSSSDEEATLERATCGPARSTPADMSDNASRKFDRKIRKPIRRRRNHVKSARIRKGQLAEA